jgi:hypothetical protein
MKKRYVVCPVEVCRGRGGHTAWGTGWWPCDYCMGYGKVLAEPQGDPLHGQR